MKDIIKVNNIDFSYNKNMRFIENLSFNLKENSYNIIIGHNGSGKTTIAKLLCGLEQIDSGNITIDGIEINSKNIGLIRKKIGVIFQNPDNQFIANNVKDDIIFGLENHNVDPSKMDEIVKNVSALTKTQGFLNREPQTLSGGEKQRVAMASILALSPKIIILDEANSMLDPQSKKEFKDLILNLKDKMNLTIISITHDINETLIADNIILLEKGKIVYKGNKEGLYDLDLNQYKLSYPSIIELQKKLKIKKILLNEEAIMEMIKGELK